MNIVYNCNDAFAVHTAVSIASLFENNKSTDRIEVYILANGVSEANGRRFKQLAAEYDSKTHPRHINIIRLEDYGKVLELAFGGEIDTAGFNNMILARIFAPQHLPDTVSRYIYLDADTVVLGDITKLWETKLGEAICGMAAEPTIYAETKEQIGLTDKDPYYNSGVLLVDRSKWEEAGISAECVACFSTFGRQGLRFPDQDILNSVLRDRLLTLSQRWNFFSNYHYRSYKSLTDEAPWFKSLITESDYECARKAPAIVHFAGAERPWLRGNHNPYRARYESYLALTPWNDTEKQGGQELNMLFYHGMNVLTEVCPAARRLISRLYIMSKK